MYAGTVMTSCRYDPSASFSPVMRMVTASPFFRPYSRGSKPKSSA